MEKRKTNYAWGVKRNAMDPYYKIRIHEFEDDSMDLII